MRRYFDYNYDGPAFDLFGMGHLLWLATIAAVVAYLIWGWRDHDEQSRRRTRLLLAIVLLITVASWYVWNLAVGAWNMQEHLPLHACAISSLATVYVLFTRNYRVYEIIFFIGMAGAVQTVLTPDAGDYGLPHFRAIQTLASHGLMIIGIVFMTTIEGFRPTWKSLWKTMLYGNIYAAFITGVNYLLGSNYMYTLRKPETASLLDHMGPWPWYLFFSEFLALSMFLLFYLPFCLSGPRQSKQ